MPIAHFLLTKSRFHILLRSSEYITFKHTNRYTDVEIYIWEMFSQRHLYFIDVKIYSVPVSSPPVLLTRNFFLFKRKFSLEIIIVRVLAGSRSCGENQAIFPSLDNIIQ